MRETVLAKRASFLALLLLFLFAGPMTATAAPVSAPLQQRADQLIALFNGGANEQELFTPAFLAQVPAAQVKAISQQLTGQFGAAKAVQRIEAGSETGGDVFVEFEKAVLQLALAIEATPPHRITGLLVTGTEMKGDSFAALLEEIRALPGETSLSVMKLGGPQPVALVAHQPDKALAIGSAFKLFILAELSRAVAAGERKWSDVQALDHLSLPSGLLQEWPKGAPLTLHSLAALMISRSDNSATDTLLQALGREKVEGIMPTLGVAAPERNRPLLSTYELFALKYGDGKLFEQWAVADEQGRRALLAGAVAGLPRESVNLAALPPTPTSIDSLEWFASAADLARAMDWLRVNGGETALAILAINNGIGDAAARSFDYVGFKGGSEPGVINLTFLLRSKSGAWHAVAASWNDKAAPVDEAKFITMVGRAVALLR